MTGDYGIPERQLRDVVSTIFMGMALSKHPQNALSAPPVKLVNTRDIGDGGLASPEELQELPLPVTSQTERYRIREGDVLVSARGTFKVGRAGEGHSGAIAGPNLVVLRPAPALESWLLYAFLRHPAVQEEIQRRSVKTTVASINIDTIASLHIRIPSPGRQFKLARLVELAEKQYILGLRIAERRRLLGHEVAAGELID